MISFFFNLFKGMIWLIVFAAILGAGLFSARGLLALRAADAGSQAAPLPVSVVEVALQDSYRAVRRFPGRIAAAQVTDVSFQVGGEITEILVNVGDRIEAGAPLARLDPERLGLRIAELDAARAEAAASLVRAEANLQRTERLLDEGFATNQALDAIVAERDGLRARVRQLARSLENARVDLADATLRAPFSGVVVNRYLDAGVTVSAGQAVLRINENGALEATIGVPARFARRIRLGDDFTVSSTDLSTTGAVTGIGDQIDEATRTVLIRLEIIEDPGFIPGGLVRIDLEEERRNRGVWVPALALSEGVRGLWSVYVVVDDGEGARIARKDVEIIHIGNDRMFVRGTLQDGDRVVAAAPFRFVPGQRVDVTEVLDMVALLPADESRVR